MRIRFRDSEDEGPLSWQEWAVVTAPVFASLWFWRVENRGLFLICAPAYLAVYALGGAVLCTGLTVLGPMQAARRSGAGLNELAERALGGWTARVVRLLGVLYLCWWGADVLRIAVWTIGHDAGSISGTWLSAGISATVLLVILSVRAGDRSLARLGRISVHLGVAVLVAGLLRVRDGVERWPGCAPGGVDEFKVLWTSLASLFALAGPIGILLAEAGQKLNGGRQARRLLLEGWAMPLAVCMLWLGILGHLNGLSRMYQPSLTPDIHMALTKGVARGAKLGVTCVLALTSLGAVRFAFWGVGRLVGGSGWRRELELWLSGVTLVALTEYWNQPWSEAVKAGAGEAGAAALTMAAAVLTVECIWPGASDEPRPRMDGVGAIALVAGAVAGGCCAWLLGDYRWTKAWLLACYAAAFLVYLGGSYWRRRGKAGGV